IDPVLVAAHIVTALQSVVSRSVDPLESAVISICAIHAGVAENVIPETVELRGTARSLTPQVRDLLERRVRQVTTATARLHGARAKLTYRRGYPVTHNHARQTVFASDVAIQVAGAGKVETNVT